MNQLWASFVLGGLFGFVAASLLFMVTSRWLISDAASRSELRTLIDSADLREAIQEAEEEQRRKEQASED